MQTFKHDVACRVTGKFLLSHLVFFLAESYQGEYLLLPRSTGVYFKIFSAVGCLCCFHVASQNERAIP